MSTPNTQSDKLDHVVDVTQDIFENAILSFHTKNNYLEVLMEKEEGEWLIDFIKELKLTEKPISYQKMKQSFEEATNSDFEVFIYSKAMNQIKEEALLIV